jgi:hypothetical protein
MMQIDGAVVREQGITFAVVAVKRHVVENRSEANQAIASFAPVFPGMPIVLMGKDSRGRATYYGRTDIARFLSRVSVNALPWKRFTIN